MRFLVSRELTFTATHLKKRLRLQANLYIILQILSLTLFEKTPTLQAFTLFLCRNLEEPVRIVSALLPHPGLLPEGREGARSAISVLNR